MTNNAPTVDLRVLSTVQLAVLEGSTFRHLDLGPPMLQTVFAVLASSVGRTVSRAELVDAVWGQGAPDSAINSVYTYATRLRKILREAPGLDDSALESSRLGYRLNLPPEGVDLVRFEARVRSARCAVNSGDSAGAVALFDEALSLWQGVPYAGATGPFVLAERQRLDELRINIIEERAELLLSMNRAGEIVDDLTKLVCQHPLRERLAGLLMKCQLALGNRAQAIRQFHGLRRQLDRDLGIEPGPDAQHIYRDILRPRLPEPRVPTPETRPAARTPDLLTGSTARLLGREPELRSLRRHVARYGRSGGPILFTGAPGVGKSALAQYFAQSLVDDYSVSVLQVSLVDGDRSLSAKEVLHHALVAMGQQPPPRSTQNWLSAAFRNELSGRQVLLLEGARATDQVRPLLPLGEHCLVLITGHHRLAGLMALDGALAMTVGPLPSPAAQQLFQDVAGHPEITESDSRVSAIVTACGGNPCAVRVAATRVSLSLSWEHELEYLAASAVRREMVPLLDLSGDTASSIPALLHACFADLPGPAQRLWRWIADTDATTFDWADAASALDGRTDQVAVSIDALYTCGVVEKSGSQFLTNQLLLDFVRTTAPANVSVDLFLQ